jgi:hypothetical protein
MKETLLSGSSDKEYSYDARIDSVCHGAMTFHALKAIREVNYSITWQQLHGRLLYLLDDAGYPQHPQLEGRKEDKRLRLFS